MPQPIDSTRLPARYYALLCDLLRADGVDVEAALKTANIWPTQLYGPDATLTVAQFETFIDQIERVSGRHDLGFLLGRQIKLSNHEILGYAILTSPTLDYAIQLASRYYRLITPAFRMQYLRGRPYCEIRFQPELSLNSQALRFLLETIVVSTHEQLKALMQGAPEYDIHVSYPQPSHIRHYASLRSARFHFDADGPVGARMVLESDLLAHPLPMADRNSLQFAEAQCQQQLLKARESRQMSEWVAMMLRESTNGFPSLADLAGLLNQSPRALDRHLQREGHRFLDISKRVRYEKACEMLDAEMPVTQIAYQLGYSEVAAFSRAFRREAGCSPTEYQRNAKPTVG
ncbi:MAG TPA: AraC family transcriptional regulator [Gammaproteobacteria bacterium]|nr:AraC family transcriptional regulator [Gammaproteobacteria bacterium]